MSLQASVKQSVPMTYKRHLCPNESYLNLIFQQASPWEHKERPWRYFKTSQIFQRSTDWCCCSQPWRFKVCTLYNKSNL